MHGVKRRNWKASCFFIIHRPGFCPIEGWAGWLMFRRWSIAVNRSRSLHLVAPRASTSNHCQATLPGTNSESEIRSWNKRISESIRVGQFDEARFTFDKMPHKNTVTWNAMISGYVKRRVIWKARVLFDEMPEGKKDIISWNLLLSGYVSCHHDGATNYVDEGRRLFDKMPRRDSVSWNTMISGYARTGRMDVALSLFNIMPEQDIVTWNTIISGFLRNGDVARAIEWFGRMPVRDFSSLSALISGLIWNGKLEEARRVLLESENVIMDGEDEDLVHAYNTLIAGYGRKGRIFEARNLFDRIPLYPQIGVEGRKFVKNVVSWNTMIMCYVKAGDVVSARALFDQMKVRDTFSWNTMISGYAQQLNMKEASELFSQMPNPDIFSWNTMVSGHAQTKDMELALCYFEKMPRKNVVSWNTLLAGFVNNGDYKGGIFMFMKMLAEGETPDKHTLSSVLSVSTGLVVLDLGRQIHQKLVKTVIPDIPINNSLVTMYSRCGAITEARTIFDEAKFQKDVITWNAMIGGYGSHGFALEALELFEAMKTLRVQPTYITFISVLNACAHTGLVEEGRLHFESMVSDFGIEPRIEHFAALVDILGRSGKLPEAMAIIKSMPIKPDKSVWGALLSSCRMHKNVELAQVAGKELIKLDPESSAPFILLYNMYVDLDLWEDATEVRKILERNDIRKQHGSSWVEPAPH